MLFIAAPAEPGGEVVIVLERLGRFLKGWLGMSTSGTASVEVRKYWASMATSRSSSVLVAGWGLGSCCFSMIVFPNSSMTGGVVISGAVGGDGLAVSD